MSRGADRLPVLLMVALPLKHRIHCVPSGDTRQGFDRMGVVDDSLLAPYAGDH
jgi:hypothetical protein